MHLCENPLCRQLKAEVEFNDEYVIPDEIGSFYQKSAHCLQQHAGRPFGGKQGDVQKKHFQIACQILNLTLYYSSNPAQRTAQKLRPLCLLA